MKMLITGALGHIGSRLVHDLPDLLPGAQADLLDDLSTQRYCSLFGLPEGCTYSFHEGDIRDFALAPLVDNADAVIHLAAVTDAQTSHERAQVVEDINHHAVLKTAQTCAASGTPMLFASTASVYGTQKDIVDESCGVEDLQPQSPYAESKLRAEAGLARLGATHGLRYVTVRFGTIFGPSPGMRFHTAVNRFIWQAVLGRPITVWRTALDQRRPYCDVRDAARSLAFLVSNDLFDGEIFNVVTLNATVRDVVDCIRDEVDTLDIELVDHRIMNQLSYEVSTARFMRRGFEYRGSLPEGVAASVALLRAANGAAACGHGEKKEGTEQKPHPPVL